MSLSRISKTFWTLLLGIVIFAISIFVFIMNLKIDISFSASLLTSPDSINKFTINSQKAYSLRKSRKIRLFFNNTYHTATVSNISQTSQKGIFDVFIIETFPDIITGTTIPIQVIYKTKKLYNEIFDNIV